MGWSSVLYKIVLLLFLGACAYEDLKTQTIPLLLPVMGAGAGILFCLFIGTEELVSVLLGTGVGAAILLVSYASRQAIGYGDGLIFLVSGLFLGGRNNLLLFFYALMCSGAAALGLLVCTRKRKKDRIPFVPFVLAAYLFLLGGM